MKHLEMYESEKVPNQELLKKCKLLFIDAWNDTLNLNNIKV